MLKSALSVTKFSDFGLQALLIRGHNLRCPTPIVALKEVLGEHFRVALLETSQESVCICLVVARAGLVDSSFHFFAPIVGLGLGVGELGVADRRRYEHHLVVAAGGKERVNRLDQAARLQ